MYDEPYDYYEEEEYKSSGDVFTLESLKEWDAKMQEAFSNLKKYIKHYGVDSKEVVAIKNEHKWQNSEYYINTAIKQVEAESI